MTGENTTEPKDKADEQILRAMRGEWIKEQAKRRPDHYLGVQDPGCTETQYRRMVM